MAIGLATPLPAMSGAEPCTGSYSALRFLVFGSTSPSEADASMPSEPVSIAAMSDSMSPNRLSVTITSNCFGLRTSCMPPESASMMLELHVLELALVHLRHHLVPQHAGLHDVALFHRGDLVAPLARKLEGDARDALDLVGVVDLGVDRALLAVAEIGDGLRLAEINAAGQLAQDHDVEPFDQLALERGGIRQRRIGHGRAQVGVKLQILAQPQQPGLRAMSYGTLSHFGPPTAPKITASAAFAFSMASSVTATRARRRRSRRPGLPRC